jgi:hypothetical protein
MSPCTTLTHEARPASVMGQPGGNNGGQSMGGAEGVGSVRGEATAMDMWQGRGLVQNLVTHYK